MSASGNKSHVPQVIVVGNEKGGSGKTTISMHIAVALMKAGQRVATIDLDSRQQSLTHYVENRRAWAQRKSIPLAGPLHFSLGGARGADLKQNERGEFADFDRAVTAAQENCDFIVIDTPPHDTFLMRLAHSVADTLVTPMNDSFIDLDVLASVDPVTFELTGVSRYGQMVLNARRDRRLVDGVHSDWFVVRNRIALRDTGVAPAIASTLAELALRLGFRVVTGLAERNIYREIFPRGLTGLDDLISRSGRCP